MIQFLKYLFKGSTKEPEIKITASLILNNEMNSAREMLKEAKGWLKWIIW